jgi:hypothetical protein
MYVKKEAVLSSMIEGTQSSLSDLLMFEFEHQPGVPLDDVQEVSNYVVALYLVPIYSNPIMFAHDLHGSHSGQNNSFF